MGFSSIGNYVDAVEGGKTWFVSFHKFTGAFAYAVGRWYDLTLLAGSPRSNVYPGGMLTATRLWYKSAGSIWHGAPVYPNSKHVIEASAHGVAATSAPAVLVLCDFLLFYPLVDFDSGDPQDMDNTQPLTRYTDGVGVRALITTTADLAGGVSGIGVTYTNHLGISGRTLPVVVNNATAAITGQIAHTGIAVNNYGPFLPLQAGDLGVRQIDSIQLTAGVGGGWGCAILVKPLLSIPLHAVGCPSERCYLSGLPSLPRVHDEAYLGWLLFTGAAVAAATTFRGHIAFAWG